MTTDGPGLVLDANILIRLVLGRRVRDIVLDHASSVAFVAPRECFGDARRYLPDLLSRRGVDERPALELLEEFVSIITPLDERTYAGARDDAIARIGSRDERDWPILAAALTLGFPIWTEDQDFFGTGVPTWTTDRVELYLRSAAQ